MQAFMAAHPMSEADPQMSSWNGGITRRQLEWLQRELSAAEVAGERVIACSHHQLGQGAARPTHMAWNWRRVQEASRGCVGSVVGSPAKGYSRSTQGVRSDIGYPWMRCMRSAA
jgi:hypothetical protein